MIMFALHVRCLHVCHLLRSHVHFTTRDGPFTGIFFKILSKRERRKPMSGPANEKAVLLLSSARRVFRIRCARLSQSKNKRSVSSEWHLFRHPAPSWYGCMRQCPLHGKTFHLCGITTWQNPSSQQLTPAASGRQTFRLAASSYSYQSHHTSATDRYDRCITRTRCSIGATFTSAFIALLLNADDSLE